MPKESEHKPHAQHNIDFLATFYTNPQYRDWVITVCFYTAVHIVECCIYHNRENIKIKDKQYKLAHSEELKEALLQAGGIQKDFSLSPHDARRMIVNYNFPKIRGEYDALYNRSRTSRYVKYSFGEEEINYILQRCLKVIMEWSNKEFSTCYDFRGM